MVVIPNEDGEATMIPEVVAKAATGTPKQYCILPFRRVLDLYWLLRVGAETFTS
jgi:hypothetical protein